MPSDREFSAGLLRSSARAYASATLNTLNAAWPSLVDTSLPKTFARPIDDIEVRILQIAASVSVDRPALLEDVLGWYKVAFHHRDVPAEYLGATLHAIDKTLELEMPRDAFALVREQLQAAISSLESAPTEQPSHLDRSAPHGETAMRFLLANLEGRGEDALDYVRGAIKDGVPIAEIQDHILSPAQREAGRMWLMAEIPIADEHYGTAIVERALGIVQEHVPRAAEDAPVVMTMGVAGNMHDLGLKVIGQRLQLEGFAVHHLGPNMPADDLAWSLQDRRVDIIAMSASMLMHLHGMLEAVAQVRAVCSQLYGSPDARPIMLGGRPFGICDDLHVVLGAQAGLDDVRRAGEVAKKLLPPVGA
ncbi:MAG: cobalamin-dependent protein [Planctomycetota bacterium]|nr:cobalamin-dependent protein [Planctomycetota bacterium]MEC8653290.1 cobalamin-dependent protein [Planctomycetota bacterium]